MFSMVVNGSFDLFPGFVGARPEGGSKLGGRDFPHVRLEVLVLQQSKYAFTSSGPPGKEFFSRLQRSKVVEVLDHFLGVWARRRGQSASIV